MPEIPPTAGLPLNGKDILYGIASGIPGPHKYQYAAGQFERMLADYLQFPEVDIYSSGTLCLSIAFQALKELTGRKKIIIPAYTCPLVAIAAYAAGVQLVVCDTQANSYEMDLEMLERLCDKSVAAVVPTDIAGLPADTFEIRKIAQAAGAYIVEDAAQALGSFMYGLPVGKYADVAVYSLAVGKGLSVYDGGIMAVKEADLREKIRAVAAKRVRKQPLMNLKRFVEMLGFAYFYNPKGLDLVYGKELNRYLDEGDLVRAVGEYFDFDIPAYEFDELRKRVGASALLRLPEFVRSNRYRALDRRLRVRRLGLEVLQEQDGAEGSWPFLMVLCHSNAHRDRIMNKLWRSGLGVTRLFIHELGGYDYLKGIVHAQDTPNARSFARRTFSISNSPFLSDDRFELLLKQIKSISQTAEENLLSNAIVRESKNF